MDEASTESADLDDLADWKIAKGVIPGDSPLGQALRRRSREIDQIQEVTAGHDSTFSSPRFG